MSGLRLDQSDCHTLTGPLLLAMDGESETKACSSTLKVTCIQYVLGDV